VCTRRELKGDNVLKKSVSALRLSRLDHVGPGKKCGGGVEVAA